MIPLYDGEKLYLQLERPVLQSSRTSKSCGWRPTNEAPEHGAHLPALANPRAHPRLPARGCVGAAGVGGPDDFPRLVQQIASFDPSQSSSCAVRTLFVIRRKLGELLGWDDADAGLGSRVPTLRDRLPADLRDGPSGPEFDALPFTSLSLTDDEWAAEAATRTIHGIIHIGRVPDQTGGFRAQMAVLVKPNGPLGAAYMAAIRPFRYLIVYPQILREVERFWRAGTRSASWQGAPA